MAGLQPGWTWEQPFGDCAEADRLCHQWGGTLAECYYDPPAGVAWGTCVDDPSRHGEFDDQSAPPQYPPDPDFPDAPWSQPQPTTPPRPPGLPTTPVGPSQPAPQPQGGGLSTGAKVALGIGGVALVGYLAYQYL